jgi:cyanophycinase
MHHLLLAAALLGQELGQPTGHLIIAGGGDTIPEIKERALVLAGGKKANVLLIPQASDRTDAGDLTRRAWIRSGAENVTVLDLSDRTAALGAIRKADLIWIPGGDQTRLMELLAKQPGIVEAIRQRFRKGATVGGTSAGAAVMSLVMLTGEPQGGRFSVDSVKTAEGLGLWPEVIVDQHYIRRARFARLLTAVLDHPACVGIGIDECTAIVVSGRLFEVIGKSQVMVIDARKATRVPARDGELGAAANVALQVLRAGMTYDLDKGLVAEVTKPEILPKPPAETYPKTPASAEAVGVTAGAGGSARAAAPAPPLR